MNPAIENGTRPRCGLRGAAVVSLVCLLVVAGAMLSAGPALASLSPPGLSGLTPSSSSLDFFSQDMHSQSPLLQETYANNSVTPTVVAPVTIIGPGASSYSISQDSCSGQTIPINTSCSVSVVFYALPSGPGAKSATLRLLDDNGINTGTTDVALSGTAITGTLSADQNSLDFGALVVNQGNSNQQHVTISNGLSASVIVNNNVQIIGADASSFNVQNNGCPNTLQISHACQIYVQFQPTSAGIQHAQLEINNDGTTDPLFVSLTGVGLNGPVVTVSPPQAIYGNVTLGDRSSQTFTLTDTGDAPLQIQAMFLVAGSPQVFPISNDNCSGRQISAGSSCQVTVGFVPIAAGDKDGSLFLITNASNPGVTTIGLNGTGVAPASPPTPTGPVPTRPPTATAPGPSPTPGAAATASNPAPTIAQLTIGKVSVHGFTITATVTVSSGKLLAAGLITNRPGLAAHTISAGCKTGQALAKKHGTRRCVSNSFGAQTLTARTRGTYTVNLSPNTAAKRGLNTGQTLRIKETLTLSTTRGSKPLRKTFDVVVHGKRTHQEH
jgi:hypothetical protein